jgi:hypothetical protein
MLSELDRARILLDITRQIENLSEQIIEMNDDINDLKAVREVLEGYRVVNIN